MKRNAWICLALEIGFVLALVAIGMIVFVTPLTSGRSETRAGIDRVNRTVLEDRGRIDQLARVASEATETSRQVRKLRNLIERAPALAKVSRELRGSARDLHLFATLNEKWNEAVAVDGVHTFTKRVSLLGSFERLGRHIEFIESLPYFLEIESLRLERTQAGERGDLEAQMKLCLRVSDPVEARAQDHANGGGDE